MMRLASYTGTRSGLSGLFNRLVRWWLHGPYSHTELVFSDGMCASCSWLDGGARLKRINITPDKWDVVAFDHTPEQEDFARQRVQESLTLGPAHRPRYSLILLAAFVVPPLRRLLGPRDQVCSTYVAWALGVPSYMQHDPNELHALLVER